MVIASGQSQKKVLRKRPSTITETKSYKLWLLGGYYYTSR